MRFDANDLESLRPLIKAIVADVLAELRQADRKLEGARLGYPEHEAAALLGLPKHVLRDCRLRGEIVAHRVGRRYVYSRDALRRFLFASEA